MEEVIKDVLMGKDVDDPILHKILEVALKSILEDRPVFSSLLTEPTLFSSILRWTKEGLDEAASIKKAAEAAIK